jgi:FtsP/CotA-like multicopper oxidase with cupredoxin domain
LAGFYIIADPEEDALNLPSGDYDIPLMIQDRTLRSDNSLFYEVNPEIIEYGFVGETLFVNGAPTPYLEVANRKYRFRLLNAANRSTFLLRLSDNGRMTVIGSDGGLLAAPVNRPPGPLPIRNGERYDIVIDFSRYPVGTSVELINTDPAFAPVLMRFDVTREEPDDSDVPAQLASIEQLLPEDAVATRTFVLDIAANGHWTINGLEYERGRIDAYPRLGTTEIWEFHNARDRPHPMHLHGVHFQRLDIPANEAYRAGWKDTFTLGGLESGRFVVRFDGYPGLYMFHCHMLEHADHHMMAQFEVVRSDALVPFTAQASLQLACPLPSPARPV